MRTSIFSTLSVLVLVGFTGSAHGTEAAEPPTEIGVSYFLDKTVHCWGGTEAARNSLKVPTFDSMNAAVYFSAVNSPRLKVEPDLETMGARVVIPGPGPESNGKTVSVTNGEWVLAFHTRETLDKIDLDCLREALIV